MRVKYRYARHIAEVVRSGTMSPYQAQFLARKTEKIIRKHNRYKKHPPERVSRVTAVKEKREVSAAVQRREQAKREAEKALGRRLP